MHRLQANAQMSLLKRAVLHEQSLLVHSMPSDYVKLYILMGFLAFWSLKYTISYTFVDNCFLVRTIYIYTYYM